MTIEVLWEAWEHQQSAYIAGRDQRFEVVLDVLAAAVPPDGTVLDLGCGTGALPARVLERFPEMTCIGVDLDPVLLAVARSALAHFDGRLDLREADLADPSWSAVLGDRVPDAVVSSTALHWLAPPQLTRLYGEVAGILPAGGIVLNADHLRFDDRTPFRRTLAALHDDATQHAAFAAGAWDWDRWWSEAEADPALAPLVPERERRYADRPEPPQVGLDFHVAALLAAGFREAGPLWQLMDDFVVVAQR